MNQMEIKETIDRYNKIIEDCFYPNKFTLNNTILEITQEIKKLQDICDHEFEDGYCIYCYKSKETN